MPAERRLVLVGAGHAHLHLVRNAERLTRAGYDVTLVAPRWFDYSGTASAVAAGDRDPSVGRIDVAALVGRHADASSHPGPGRDPGPVRHLDTIVESVDPSARTVETADGRTVSFDVLSLNVGSVAAPPARHSESSAATCAENPALVAVKPLADLAALRTRLRERPNGRGHHVTVVGAGPSGIELAAHLAARADTDRVLLVEAGPRLAPSLPSGAVRRLSALLIRRGVEIRTDTAIAEVTGAAIVLADGTRIPHDTAVLATGLTAPPLARQPGLGSPEGIPVRSTLEHRDHEGVYAVGDCADFLPGRLPRVGVHGVRQGPVLLAALEARATGAPAPTYRPPRRALTILDLGDGMALAARGCWWWMGRASLALKHRIDERWLSLYRS